MIWIKSLTENKWKKYFSVIHLSNKNESLGGQHDHPIWHLSTIFFVLISGNLKRNLKLLNSKRTILKMEKIKLGSPGILVIFFIKK
jgi:hypothetical protein